MQMNPLTTEGDFSDEEYDINDPYDINLGDDDDEILRNINGDSAEKKKDGAEKNKGLSKIEEEEMAVHQAKTEGRQSENMMDVDDEDSLEDYTEIVTPVKVVEPEEKPKTPAKGLSSNPEVMLNL